MSQFLHSNNFFEITLVKHHKNYQESFKKGNTLVVSVSTFYSLCAIQVKLCHIPYYLVLTFYVIVKGRVL